MVVVSGSGSARLGLSGYVRAGPVCLVTAGMDGSVRWCRVCIGPSWRGPVGRGMANWVKRENTD